MADFELKINPEGLQTAASAYSTAASSFSTTVGELKTALNSALSVWQDNSEENWTARVQKAISDLDAVNQLLEGNKNALNDIASFAIAAQGQVNQGIQRL